MFPPDTIWWKSVNAFTLTDLKVSPIKDYLIEIFMNHCKKSKVTRDSYMRQQRHMCECKLCKYHPDYPKPAVYHMGNLAEHFGENFSEGDKKLCKDRIERPDYTVKMPGFEMFKTNKICKENDHSEKITVEAEIEPYRTDLTKPDEYGETSVISSDDEKDCDCKFLGMNINTKFVLHLPDFCSRFYDDDLTDASSSLPELVSDSSKSDAGNDEEDQDTGDKEEEIEVIEEHSQDYSPWNDKLKVEEFKREFNSI